jgi:hypothetical protein
MIDLFLFRFHSKDTLLDANRKGIKRAQAKLDALREQYRNDQIKEMEKNAKAKADANRLAQEQAHLAALKAQVAAEQGEMPLSQLAPSDAHPRSRAAAAADSKPETVSEEAAETEAEAEVDAGEPLLLPGQTDGAGSAAVAEADVAADSKADPIAADENANDKADAETQSRQLQQQQTEQANGVDSPALVASQTLVTQQ